MKNQLISSILVIVLITGILPGLGSGQVDDGAFSFDHYNDYQTVKNRIENLSVQHPDICKMMVIGRTYEGRDIIAVRLTDNPDTEEMGEVDVLIMGGHHAKELPSVEVPMYILEFLAGNYSSNSSVRQLVDSRDIWFVPMLNPDGREYAMNTDVNWRKNRRPIDLDGDGTLEGIGVDLNRNYGHLWGQQGTSADPTSNIYCGPGAFSENETQAIRALVNNQNFSISLSYHTYGQIIYYPWGNGIDTASPKRNTLQAIASELGQRTGYTPMEGKDAYLTTGDSDDWLYAETDCLPFTIELGNQFVIPETDIESLCRNNLDAAIYALEIADEPEQAARPDWTFMVYMSADADKSLADEAIVDLNEMEVTGSSSELNIIVLYDGPNAGDAVIYQIQKDSDGYNTAVISPTLDDQGQVIPASGEVDMSRYSVMNDFVNWAMSNYPARNYFLDVWGHGNGILSGFAYDRGNLMPVDDLSEALCGIRLDIVGFDTCSMGHFEVAAELVGISDILIGSEAEEPLSGWDYIASLQKLAANTNMNSRELAGIIVLDYLDRATASYVTLAAIDLNVFRNELLPQLNEFASVSLDFAYPDHRNIWITRNYTDTFVNEADAVDLFEYLKNLDDIEISDPVMNRIQKLLALKDEIIIASGSGVGHPDSDTMAVYFPVVGMPIPAKYLEMDFSENLWDEYLAGINSPVQKPVINASRLEGEVNSTGPQTISASLSLLDNPALELHYRVNSGMWNSILMNASGNQYSGIIPGQANGSVVEYYFLQPDTNITEPYEAKWGQDMYFNYSVSAFCNPAILELVLEPSIGLVAGNLTSISINYTNFGPGYALVNLTLEAVNSSETLLLYWELITIQPGESFTKRINWTMETGHWNISARVISLGFRDSDISNDLKSTEINVSRPGQQSVINTIGSDYTMILGLLLCVAMIPLIGFMLVFRNIRKKRITLAERKIISARTLMEMAHEFGGDTTQSKIMLINAETALKMGNPGESEKWSRKARDEAMNSVAEREVK